MAEPAAIKRQSSEKALARLAIPLGNVYSSALSTITNGQRKSPHIATKVKTASVIKAGRAAGSITCYQIPILEQPSIRAASSISLGTLWKA